MEQEFHDRAATQDVISLVGELEHSYRHALRSAAVTDNEEEKTHFAVVANRLRQIRREVMKKELPSVGEHHWCLCKSTACIRQLSYELFRGDLEQLKDIDDLVDRVWSKATGEDLSGCEACREDSK